MDHSLLDDFPPAIFLVVESPRRIPPLPQPLLRPESALLRGILGRGPTSVCGELHVACSKRRRVPSRILHLLVVEAADFRDFDGRPGTAVPDVDPDACFCLAPSKIVFQSISDANKRVLPGA